MLYSNKIALGRDRSQSSQYAHSQNWLSLSTILMSSSTMGTLIELWGPYFDISSTVLKASNNNTNLETNTALRRLVDEALAQNIPKATLDKVLKRSKNDEELATEFLFEIRGPGRTAVVVECLAKSKGLLPVKINPILRKHGSVEEKGVVNMFDKEIDKSDNPSISAQLTSA